MIDVQYGVERYISEFANQSGDWIANHELREFDLCAFRQEFGEKDAQSPLFYCYPVQEPNIVFLKKYLVKEPNWDFEEKRYFRPLAELSG